jgi:hypothetical protein
MEHVMEKSQPSSEFYDAAFKVYKHANRAKKALDMSLKKYRLYLHSPELEVNEAIYKRAVDATLEVMAAYLAFGPKMEENRHGAEEVVCKDYLFQARMNGKSMLSRLKKSWEEMEDYNRLKSRLAEIQQMELSGR